MRLPARLLCLVVAALCFSNAFAATLPSFAQNYGVGGYDWKGHPTSDPYYGSGIDVPRAIVPMPDGGFVVAGQISFPYLYLNVYAGGNPDAALVRFSKEGTILWQKTLHLPGTYDYSGYVVYKPTYVAKMATDAQGNIFVAGANNNEAGAPFVAKFSPDGDLIWQNAILGVHLVYGDPPQSVDAGTGAGGMQMTLTNDGGALISFAQGRPFGYTIPAIAKFNSDGSQVFYKAFDNPDQYSESPHVCQTADGTKYVLAIRYPVTSNNQGPIYGLGIIVVDAATGNLISQNGWSSLDGASETVNSIIRTSDNGFAVLSTRPGSGVVFRKFNSDASATTIERVIRQGQYYPQFYVGSMSQASDVGSFSQTADGGFLIGGHTSEQNNAANSYEDMALMKLHPDGTLEWVSIFGGTGNEGNTGGANSGSVATQLSDGSYGFAVSSSSYKTEPFGDGGPGPKPDWWVGKTDANRHLRNFTGTMADLPLDYYVVSDSTPQSPVALSYYFPPNYSCTPFATSPLIGVVNIEGFTPPNLPTLTLQASSPRIISKWSADAIVQQHFSYRILTAFFPQGSTLTYSAVGLPSGFKIDSVTGIISGYPDAGSETVENNLPPIAFTIYATDGVDTAQATLRVAVSNSPPHLLVNGSDQPAYPPSATAVTGLADTVLSFVAQYSGRQPGQLMNVEATTTPGNDLSWQRLTNGSNGYMAFENASAQYVLNSTHYPQQSGVYFRAKLFTTGRPDRISNVVGPFDLTSSAPRAGQPILSLIRNGIRADFDFRATLLNAPAGVSLRVQRTTTPSSEGSWLDLPDNNGAMKLENNVFTHTTNNVPISKGVYFRVVATTGGPSSGNIDALSNIIGPYDLKTDTPPKVTLNVPAGSSGGDGTDGNPYIYTTDANGSVNLHITGHADSTSFIKKLSLRVDGSEVEGRGGGATTIASDYPTSQIGARVIELLAVDESDVTARAGTGPLYIRIVPAAATNLVSRTNAPSSNGRFFGLKKSAVWTDASAWSDIDGANGVPGPNDEVLIGGPYTLSFPTNGTITVGSIEIPEGNSTKLAGPGYLKVLQKAVISSGSVQSSSSAPFTFEIAKGAVCEMRNKSDFSFGGWSYVINGGTWLTRGYGSIVGLKTFTNTKTGTSDFHMPLLVPADVSAGLSAADRVMQMERLVNDGKISATGIATSGGGNIVATGAGNVLQTSGGSIVATGAGNLVEGNGGTIVASGAGNIVASGAGNIVASGAGNLSVQGSNSIVATGAGNAIQQGSLLIGNDGAGLIGNDGAGIVASGAGNFKIGPSGNGTSSHAFKTSALNSEAVFVQTSGQLNMDYITISGDIDVEGGTVSGSGTVDGSLAMNGGVITTGAGAGLLTINGDYAQGANAMMIVKASGGDAGQYDQIQVNGSASLGGKLTLYTLDGYVPLENDGFAPVGYQAVNGSFDAVNGNAGVAVTPEGVISTLAPQSAPPPALQVTAVKSRKTHGAAGTFDVNLGLDGSGVEPRSGGANGSFTVVFTLANPLTSVDSASVVTGSGSVVSAGIGANPQEYVVELTGVSNAQKVGLSLSNLKDTFDQTSSSAAGFLSVLLGDANGDGKVNSGDATIVRNRSGKAADATNFRADVTADGVVNSGDATTVRNRSGSSLGTGPATAVAIPKQTSLVRESGAAP